MTAPSRLCPNCAGGLSSATHPNADSPPWKCLVCSRAWWAAEIVAAAVAAWDPAARVFTSPSVVAAAIAEWRLQRQGAGEPT